jgi:hypothetical protein
MAAKKVRASLVGGLSRLRPAGSSRPPDRDACRFEFLFQHQERLACCLDVEASTFKAGTFNAVDQELYARQTRGDDFGLHQHQRRRIVALRLDLLRAIGKKLSEREVSGNAALSPLSRLGW